MERLMPMPSDPHASTLSQAAGRLHILLEEILPSGSESGAPTRLATPQQMSALLAELMRAGECLRTLPEQREAFLQQQLAEYRKQVERLHKVLPAIHAALLEERARLERERERVHAAAQWVQASRQTL